MYYNVYYVISPWVSTASSNPTAPYVILCMDNVDMDTGPLVGALLENADMDTVGGIDMVVVSVSETYDLSTLTNKMSLIGIHTPDLGFVAKMYPGLFMSCRRARFVKCDVSLACASYLPADPQQIGVSNGDIAPQDMFNPILYKAVSNQSLSQLEARLAYLYNRPASEHPLNGPSVLASNSDVTALADEFAVYYGLLSNRDGFRTANPQAGLTMRNLKPMVFEKLYNYGETRNMDNSFNRAENENVDSVASNGTSSPTTRRSMFGNAKPMPWFNTTVVGGYTTTPGFADGVSFAQGRVPFLPPVFVSLIVMPPSKLQQLYYRLVVRWFVEFDKIRPITEVADFPNGIATAGNLSYNTDYVFADSLKSVQKMTTDMVDTCNGDISKIMEGS